MKKTIFIFGIVVLISSVLGCDKIENLFAPKAQVTAPATIKETPGKVTANLQPQGTQQGTQLAKVNDKLITYEEFEQNIKNLKALSEDIKIENFEEKKNLLDEMVNQELLYQEARSRGIQNRKDIKDLAEGYLRGLVVRQLILDVTENVTVDAQEIETFYNQYKDQFSEPEQRHVREIVVSAEDRAREISVSLLQGGDFATIAKEKSINDSSKNAGDIGFIAKGQLGEDYKKFDEIVFSQDVGQISSIFKGPKGFYIVKVEEIKEPKAKTLTTVWDQVKNNLLSFKQQQRLQDMIDKLKRDAKVEINEELLKNK